MNESAICDDCGRSTSGRCWRHGTVTVTFPADGRAPELAVASKPYRFDLPTRTAKEQGFLEALEAVAAVSQTTNVERFMAFPLWAPRQNIARFIAQVDIFRRVLDVQGSVVECGVAFGGGVMAWAHLSAIFEPVNHPRRVIAFDTFEGFPGMASQDARAESGLAYEGGMAVPLYEEIGTLASIHDQNRPLGHIPKVELVKGDACRTIPAYVKDNPALVVSLLVLDFDIYEPTLVALDHFVPLMPKGAVIVFDELGVRDWPGEAQAVLKRFGTLNRLRVQRFPFASTISYAVLE